MSQGLPPLPLMHCLISYSVSVRGTAAAEWDKNTWGPLEDLAQNHPEAGVHFQGTTISLSPSQTPAKLTSRL